LEILSLFIADNWVGSEWVMTGTASTGKRFSTQGASISELQEGKIKRNTDYYDPASFLEATHE
jgi:ketosteroid isomerase-like protein